MAGVTSQIKFQEAKFTGGFKRLWKSETTSFLRSESHPETIA